MANLLDRLYMATVAQGIKSKRTVKSKTLKPKKAAPPVSSNEDETTNQTKKCNECLETKDVCEFDKKGFRRGRREWQTKCKMCRKGHTKRHYANHKTTILQRNATYYSTHKESVSAQHVVYRSLNVEMIRDARKIFYIENNERLSIIHKAYVKQYYLDNPDKKLADLCRRRAYRLLSNSFDSKQYYKLIGCTSEFLERWFEFNLQYEPNMTMENRSKTWHIDHVIPCELWDLSDTAHISKCFHWSNTSPMIIKENIAKGATILDSQVEEHNNRLKVFCAQESIDILIVAKPTIAGTS